MWASDYVTVRRCQTLATVYTSGLSERSTTAMRLPSVYMTKDPADWVVIGPHFCSVFDLIECLIEFVLV